MNSTYPVRRRARLALLPLLLSLAVCSTARADRNAMSFALAGGAQVPPVVTAAKGVAKITVHDDRTVSGGITVSSIAPTAAQIQEGAAGETGMRIITLEKSGDDTFRVPRNTKLTQDQYQAFLAGKLYVNVLSNAHPEGEIRAQLTGMQ